MDMVAIMRQRLHMIIIIRMRFQVMDVAHSIKKRVGILVAYGLDYLIRGMIIQMIKHVVI